MTSKPSNTKLYSQIVDLLQSARRKVVRTVNQTMVLTYFEIGRILVEEEQGGKKRAGYGKQVIKELSKVLSKEFGKGFSERNIEQMRQFYLVYSKPQTVSAELENQKAQTASAISISETPSRELENQIQQTPSANSEPIPKTQTAVFNLSWSHYLTLLRIENENERKFYEIESYNNNWSVRELKRQYDSALYTRLVLSRDKEKVKELSDKGHIVAKPRDTIKDPYILNSWGFQNFLIFQKVSWSRKSLINSNISCWNWVTDLRL